jgi:hypothetical protein
VKDIDQQTVQTVGSITTVDLTSSRPWPRSARAWLRDIGAIVRTEALAVLGDCASNRR